MKCQAKVVVPQPIHVSVDSAWSFSYIPYLHYLHLVSSTPEVLHRSQTLILTWPMPKAVFLSFFYTLLKVKINPGSMPLSGCVTNISGVYFGWDPCPIQVSWKCVLQFLCNPADNPTNQQTDRKENLLGRCNKPKCLTLCQHPRVWVRYQKFTMYIRAYVSFWSSHQEQMLAANI